MKIVSLNVGLPVEVTWRGRKVTTGIYKEPVAGRIQLRTAESRRRPAGGSHGPRGQGQGRLLLPARTLRLLEAANCRAATWRAGAFGENFTTEGCWKTRRPCRAIGSRSVRLKWWSRSLACLATNWAIKFRSDDMVKRFFASRRTGFYLAVAARGRGRRGR